MGAPVRPVEDRSSSSHGPAPIRVVFVGGESDLIRAFDPSSGAESVPQGGVIWISGYSGAGKTTVGRKVAARLRAAGTTAVILDGDDLRAILAHRWGYGRSERIDLALVYLRLASTLAAQGQTVVLSAVAMFDEVRAFARDTSTAPSRSISTFPCRNDSSATRRRSGSTPGRRIRATSTTSPGRPISSWRTGAMPPRTRPPTGSAGSTRRTGPTRRTAVVGDTGRTIIARERAPSSPRPSQSR